MRQSGYVVAGLSVCRIKTTREACTANALGAGGRVPRWRLPLNSDSCLAVTCTAVAYAINAVGDGTARRRRSISRPLSSASSRVNAATWSRSSASS
jgi:hypothetical protein